MLSTVIPASCSSCVAWRAVEERGRVAGAEERGRVGAVARDFVGANAAPCNAVKARKWRRRGDILTDEYT